MKNFLTSLILSLSCLLVHAQQDRFIYLQTENKQPFFVKLDKKILNSYPLGYLIIPKLDDGLYSIVIGFPQSDYEQEFNCSINNKDIGFIIKNSGDKQWQLLNVQSLNVIVPGEVITKKDTVYEKETDPFSTMLANVVHDQTILRKDLPKQIPETKQKDSAGIVTSNTDVAIIKTDSTALSDSAKNITAKITSEKTTLLNQKDSAITVNQKDVAISNSDKIEKQDSAINKDVAKINSEKGAEINKTDSTQSVPNDVAVVTKKKKSRRDKNSLQDSVNVQKDLAKEIIPEKIKEKQDSTQGINPDYQAAIVKSIIKRKLKKNSKEGIEMIYVDDNGDTRDTIRILIPSEKKKKADEIQTETVIVPVTQSSDTLKKVMQNKNDKAITDEEKKIIQEAKKDILKPTMINSDCKNFADEDDFLKIRKKMVAQNNDEDMVKAAKKVFKTRCFTTEQIKNLSVLFLKDDGKYMFFDAAYPFVSDSDLYGTLEKQLSDNYYITRFRAMIHK